MHGLWPRTQVTGTRMVGLLAGLALLATSCTGGGAAGGGPGGQTASPTAGGSPGGQQAQTTRGEFHPITANTDLDISGQVELVRTGGGETKLSVRVTGLRPNTTYPAHLHTGSCANLDSPHYRHDPNGPGKPPNELWLSSDPDEPMAGLRSNPAGVANGRGAAPWRARPAADTVFVHAPDSTKIACATLGNKPQAGAGSPPAADVTHQVTITNGNVSPPPGRVKVGQGQMLRLTVTSDRADTVHVHGYDLEKLVTPSQPAVFTFTADQRGVFEVETHQSELQLLQLQVQ